MSGHTPAPWSVFNTADIFTDLGALNAEGINAPSKDGWMIADCDMGGLSLAEVRANARLIAAAPDLLEALKYMLAVCPAIDDIGEEARLEASAAIAKATGETK